MDDLIPVSLPEEDRESGKPIAYYLYFSFLDEKFKYGYLKYNMVKG